MNKILISIILFLLLAPMACLVIPSLGNYAEVYFVPKLLMDYASNTVILMLGVGFLSLFFGVSSAILMSFFNFKGKLILKNLLFFPLAFPVYVMALVYTRSAEKMHFLHLSHVGELIFAILVMSLCFYPYVYMIVSSRLSSLVNMVALAKSMGKNPLDIIKSIIIPISRPAIMSSLFLVVMENIADFGAVQFFSIQTFTTGIYRNWFLLHNHQISALLTFILLVFVFLLVFLERLSRKNKFYNNVVYTNMFKYVEWQLTGIKAFAAFLFCGILIFLGFFFPFITIIFWTTQASIDWSKLIEIIFNTSFLSFFASVIATAISVMFVLIQRV